MLLQPERDLGRLDDGPLLIFGGPYSNLAASTAMLDVASARKIPASRIICTGDVVAYCAEPDQTCQLLKASGIEVVMGNCEESLAFGADDCGCGFEPGMLCSTLSRDWYGYASSRISADSRDWMSDLPRLIRFEYGGLRCLVVHGAPERINRFVFASSSDQDKRSALEACAVDVIIGGHCGLPFGQRLDAGFWLNAGVIGLPANDGGRHGWYMLLSTKGGEVIATWHRLDYDAALSARHMAQAGLSAYADTLCNGLWPSMDVLPPGEREQAGKALKLPPLSLAAAGATRRH